jgi:hypothetical protein
VPWKPSMASSSTWMSTELALSNATPQGHN